jgi:opacity protein-like surface antigen
MNRSLIFLSLLILSSALSGQEAKKWRHTWTEIVLDGGTMKMLSDMDKNQWALAGSAGLRFKVQKYWTVSVTATYSSLSGSEPDSSFSYHTWLVAPSMRAEYHFFNRKERTLGYNRRELILWEPKMTGYALVGIGGIYFHPEPGGDLVNQYSDDFPTFRHAYVLGLGYKYSLNNRFSVGIETGYQFTGTDYLDVYCPAGQDKNDKLFFAHVTISYLLNLKKMRYAVD